MSLYRAIRRFVDWDLSHGPRLGQDGRLVGFGEPKPGISLLLAILPIVGAAFAGTINDAPVLWSTALAIVAIWLSFVAWRAARLMKARAYKSGRYYERRGRYYLPSEYADTTSAILDHRRES